MQDEILATVEASATRRWFGIGALGVLGVLLLWLAFTSPPASVVLLALLVLFGLGAIWLGVRMYHATLNRIELTANGLRDGQGQVIAAMDDILTVERGMLAFKPSNGFMVKTKTPQSRIWQLGLFWRVGRRIGVGGVTPAAQGKTMADILSMQLRERDGD